MVIPENPPNSRLDYFSRVYRNYQKNLFGCPKPPALWLNLADKKIRLNFTDSKLKKLAARLMGHLEIPAGTNPDFTVYCWQNRKIHGTEAGWMGITIPDKISEQAILSFNRDFLQGELHLSTGTEAIIDLQTNTGLYRLSGKDDIAFFEQASLLRPLLRRWLSRQGLIMIHAAAIGNSGKGVLLAGGGGSGKSTTALRCLTQGMDFAGDDRVIIQSRPSRIFGLYACAKISSGALRLLPELLQNLKPPDNSGNRKKLVYILPEFRNQMTASFSLSAIALPAIKKQKKSGLIRISPAEALRSLAPSTILSQPEDGKKEFAVLADLVRRVPCYRLELGKPGPAEDRLVKKLIMEIL